MPVLRRHQSSSTWHEFSSELNSSNVTAEAQSNHVHRTSNRLWIQTTVHNASQACFRPQRMRRLLAPDSNVYLHTLWVLQRSVPALQRADAPELDTDSAELGLVKQRRHAIRLDLPSVQLQYCKAAELR